MKTQTGYASNGSPVKILPFILTINPVKFISLLIGSQFLHKYVGDALNKMNKDPILHWELSDEAKKRWRQSFMIFEPCLFHYLWDSMDLQRHLDEINFLAKEEIAIAPLIYIKVAKAINKRYCYFSEFAAFGRSNDIDTDLIELFQCAYCESTDADHQELVAASFWEAVQQAISIELTALTNQAIKEK